MAATEHPDQPPGFPGDDNPWLPLPTDAAERILAFVSWFGDGRAWVGANILSSDPPLFARDLEAVAKATRVIASVQALADRWNDTPDYTVSDYDQGRVDQRHDMTGQLLALLPVEA